MKLIILADPFVTVQADFLVDGCQTVLIRINLWIPHAYKPSGQHPDTVPISGI